MRGVVQGVGFRPFVYRLAHHYHLNGRVRNTSGSVDIEVEGAGKAVRNFINDLQTKAPPVARIENIKATFHSPRGFTEFQIEPSLSREGQYQLVSPDIATCADCQKEIFSHSDRRSGYPFTNCTNCGPRFTIIEDIPYDRPKTTMRKFKMCPRCQREYDDPLDRRFHAQPNACPVCGPSLELVDSQGNPVEGKDIISQSTINRLAAAGVPEMVALDIQRSLNAGVTEPAIIAHLDKQLGEGKGEEIMKNYKSIMSDMLYQF